MDSAFAYVKTAKLELESDYPYRAVDGKCKYSAAKGKVGVSGYVDVPKNDPAQLESAVAKQPVSVAIEADTYVFQSYAGGIISSSNCGT